MNPYPMQMTKQSFGSRGGTKDYNFTLVETADNKALIIKRWGKVGAAGQFQIHAYDDVGAANQALSQFNKERVNKGYRLNESKDRPIAGQSDLVAGIGRAVFPKIGASAVKHIDPGFDTSGMGELDANTYDEDGNWLSKNAVRRATVDQEAMARDKAAREAAERKELESHPLYGMF